MQASLVTTHAGQPNRRLGLLIAGLTLAVVGYVSYFPWPEDPEESEPPLLARAWLQATDTKPARRPDVVFVPTPQPVVDRMIELAQLKPGDVLYDLGCGDGRFVVTAAKKHGVRAVGIDIDPVRVLEARRNARTNGVERLVTIHQADIFEFDFSDATVVTLYLLPELNVKLMPKLAKLKPGTRILSFEFDMRGAKPAETIEVPREGGQRPYRIYKWVVPWEPE